MIPIRRDNETAISILAASCALHGELAGCGVVGGQFALPAEIPVGITLGISAKDIFCISRSITWATIKQMTAKLPKTARRKLINLSHVTPTSAAVRF